MKLYKLWAYNWYTYQTLLDTITAMPDFQWGDQGSGVERQNRRAPSDLITTSSLFPHQYTPPIVDLLVSCHCHNSSNTSFPMRWPRLRCAEAKGNYKWLFEIRSYWVNWNQLQGRLNKIHCSSLTGYRISWYG